MEPSETKHARFPLMELNVKLLKIVRFWNETPGLGFPIIGHLINGIYIFVWLIPSCVFIATSQENITLLLKAATEQFVFVTIFFKLCSFGHSYSRWERVFYDFQQAFETVMDDPHAEVQAVLARVRKVSYYLTRYYCSILIFNCMLYGLFPMIYIAIRYAVTGAYSVPLSTPIEGNFGIPGYRSIFWVWLPLDIIFNGVLLLHALALCTMECFIWNLIHDNICLFRILRTKADQLGAADGTDRQWAVEIDRFVSLHNCALRSAAVLEENLGGQMLFLYMSTIFSLCLMMMVISIAFKDIYLLITMLCVIGYCLFQTFCFSILGTELMEESAAVADAIFHSKWYASAVGRQRDLAFILVRSQEPVKLTAAKLFIVTRVSFAQVLKQAYTIFTLMSQLLIDTVN